jgi:glucose-6-phosphate dehydrogenase assembly protein OpcA
MKIPNNSDQSPCLFNLIVYTEDTQRTHYFQGVIELIIEQFPCRVIFIQANPSAQQNLVRYQPLEMKNSKGTMEGNQFLIEVSGQEVRRTYLLLPPLFVPDLPIYLIWGRDPEIISPELQSFATRLIVDSEVTENLEKFSAEMLNQLHSASIPIVDMNWARIGGWRYILAQIFDSPERLEQLNTADSIRIVYNHLSNDVLSHPETQAVYLQSWLAACLKWQWKKSQKVDQEWTIDYESHDAKHTITFASDQRNDLPSEELLEMEIHGLKDYECHIKRTRIDEIEVRACNQFQCELPFVLLMPTLRSGRHFIQEIFYQKISPHYLPTLQLMNLSMR